MSQVHNFTSLSQWRRREKTTPNYLTTLPLLVLRMGHVTSYTLFVGDHQGEPTTLGSR